MRAPACRSEKQPEELRARRAICQRSPNCPLQSPQLRAILLRGRLLRGPVFLDAFPDFLDGGRTHLLLSRRAACSLRNRSAPLPEIPAIAPPQLFVLRQRTQRCVNQIVALWYFPLSENLSNLFGSRPDSAMGFHYRNDKRRLVPCKFNGGQIHGCCAVAGSWT